METRKTIMHLPQLSSAKRTGREMVPVPSGIMASANLKRDASLHIKRSLIVISKRDATEKTLVRFFTGSLTIAAFDRTIRDTPKRRQPIRDTTKDRQPIRDNRKDRQPIRDISRGRPKTSAKDSKKRKKES